MARSPSWTSAAAAPVAGTVADSVTVCLSPLTVVVIPLLVSNVTMAALIDNDSELPATPSNGLVRVTTKVLMLIAWFSMLADDVAMAVAGSCSV